MAFNPSDFYGAVFNAQNNMLNRQDQQRQNNMNALSNLAQVGVGAYKDYQNRQAIDSAIDPETGLIDNNKYVSALAKIDPNRAIELQNTFLTNSLKQDKLKEEANLLRANTAKAQGTLTNDTNLTNAKVDTEQANAKAKMLEYNINASNQLNAMVDSSQTDGEFQSVLKMAANAGIPQSYLDEYIGKPLTPELKAKAKAALGGYIDYQKQMLEQTKADIQAADTASQINTREGNLALRSDELDATQAQRDKENIFSQKRIDAANQANQLKAEDIQNQKEARQEANQDKKEVKFAEQERQYQSNMETADSAYTLINEILNSPLFNKMAGGGLLSTALSKIPSALSQIFQGKDDNGEQKQTYADFDAKLQTLFGKNFLQAVQSLRGLGALSNAEGDKVKSSTGVLNYNMSAQALRETLTKMKDSIIKFKKYDTEYYNKLKSVTYKDQNSQTQNTSTTPSQSGSTTLFTPEQLSKFKAMQAAGIR